jgi:predicted metal-dependent hydrolase
MMRQFQRKNQIIAPLEFSWPENFTAGQTLPFRGRRLMLNIKFGVRASTQLQENVLLITLPWISIKCEDIEINIKKQILLWYQQQTHDFIAQSIEIFCPQLGRWPAGFGLKQQKTRWGSCGIQQKIYINWLLVLAPIGVLEYVVAHELCHLFHRNHGKRFWAKVANCYAEYETHEKWLTKHGHLLMPAQRM